MKGRDSGMPEEGYWESFFDADCVVARLDRPGGSTNSVVEFGCGYGTFTLAAARGTSGEVFALDIEPELVELVRVTAEEAGLEFVRHPDLSACCEYHYGLLLARPVFP